MGADSSDDGGDYRLDEVILDDVSQVDDQVGQRRRERCRTTPPFDRLMELDLEAELRDVLHEGVVRLLHLRSSFPACGLEDDQGEGHPTTVALMPDDATPMPKPGRAQPGTPSRQATQEAEGDAERGQAPAAFRLVEQRGGI